MPTPSSSGRARTSSPYSSTSAALTCSFVRPSVDEVADQLALARGLRRLGDVQRDVAGHAHDLVLDVGERRAAPRPRARARRARGRRATSERRAASRRPHQLERLRRRTPASTWPREIGDDPPLAVDHERLGHAGRLEVLAQPPSTSRRLGNDRPCSRMNARESSLASETVTPSTVPPAPSSLRVRALEQRRLGLARLAPRCPEVHDHRLAAPVGERALAAVEQRQLASGAAGRSPALTASSSVVDVPAPTTP